MFTNCIKEFFSFLFILIITLIAGPILSTSYYYSNKFNYTSYGFIIMIIIGLTDSILYGIGLYLSMKSVDELYNQQIIIDRKPIDYHIIQEKQLLEPVSETIELFLRTQTDLYDLIDDLIKTNITDDILIQNSQNKLRTLKFIQNDSLMTIKTNISERLRILQLNSSVNNINKKAMHTYFNHSILSNSFIFNRIYFYIFTYSFLLYLHQFVLWILQYLSLKNSMKYDSYSFIISIVILSQSLGLIYFLQVTNTFYFLSPVYFYTSIFFLRSLISIYHSCFSIQ
ncbi:unnamed protein product [Adineta steineri]|uniref:Uncharacterized protein n=1 Tax=Adineta steineri TaxID=433720 RepID=A0A815DCM6_9BILA|nr:unnamed protein product [Adineta steineri]